MSPSEQTPVVSPHPSANALGDAFNERLSPEQKADVALHLASCAECTRRFSLLDQANEMTPEVLPASLSDVVLPLTQLLKRGTVLGRYVVLDPLGAGGMGEVYSAIDPELDRTIALKLVRASGASGSEAQTRLLREAQAMAKLAHPNVVSIYDVGVVDGRVFLAMELVTGSTLTQWLKTQPRTWQAIITLFAEAGQGLAAAHRAGMVHRDFKPDNLLIGLDGRARVSDFGLARSAPTGVTEPSALEAPALAAALGSAAPNLLGSPMTQAALVLGTPGYMAPEQFDGATASAHSDQFSFCVSLYKALYGQPPFLNENLPSLVRAVRAGAVQPPPSGSKVPSFVHRVVLKGLSVDPAARFVSIDELLVALADDPARARMRWALAGAAALFAVLLVGGAAVAMQRYNTRCTGAELKLVGLWDAQRKTELESAFRKTDVVYAGDVWHTVETSLERYATEWVAQRTEACEATWFKGKQSDAVLTLRMQCLSDRLDELRSITDLLGKVDAAAIESAAKAPTALTELGRCADVAALERRAPMPKNADEQRRVEALQHSLNGLSSLFTLGRYQEGAATAERIAEEAKTLGYAPLRASATFWLVRFSGKLGRFSVIRELLFETVRLAEIAGDDVLRFEGTVTLASLGLEVGESLEQLLTYTEIAESMLGRIKGTDRPAVKLQVVRGNVLLTRERYDEAVKAYEKGRLVAEASQQDLTDDLSDLMDNIALAHHFQHLDYQSLAENQRSLSMMLPRLGPKHPDVAYTNLNVAEAYLALNEPEQALKPTEASLAARLETLGPEHVLTAECLFTRGRILGLLGRVEEGRKDLITALETVKRLAPISPIAMQVSAGFGEFSLAEKDAGGALAHFEHAAQLAQTLETNSPGNIILGRALALGALGRRAEALTGLDEAIAALTKEKDNAGLFRAHFGLADLLWQPGSEKSARAHAETALHLLGPIEGNTTERQVAIRKWLTEHPGGPG